MTGLSDASAPYWTSVLLDEGAVEEPDRYPWHLPAFQGGIDIEFHHAVTFLVGENGSGKSTLMEAMVALERLPIAGGGRNELGERHAPHRQSALAPTLRRARKRSPPTAYFFRAEHFSQLARLIDSRGSNPDEWGAGAVHGMDRRLADRSHGEAYLSLARAVIGAGLYFMDEPETSLSPMRQLALLSLMAQSVTTGRAQFIVATHSPILLTFPGATILNLGEDGIQPMDLEDSEHYQVTRGILEHPARYWRHLVPRDE